MIGMFVKQSLIQRKQLPRPDIAWQITFCSLVVAAYIFVALFVSPEQRESHFVREDGAITALSAIFLAISSGFAGVSFYLSLDSNLMCRVFWMVSTAALGFLALDELLSFQENLDIWIAGRNLATSTVFRNWNDLMVIGYGIVGPLATPCPRPPTGLRKRDSIVLEVGKGESVPGDGAWCYVVFVGLFSGSNIHIRSWDRPLPPSLQSHEDLF